MTLLSKIREDSVAARKAAVQTTDAALKVLAGDKASFLITLFAEAARKGKDDGNRESTDAEVVATVKKFIDNANDTLKALGEKAPDQRARIEAELTILRGYMPAQADPEAVKALIAEVVAGLAEKSPKQMGVVMGKLTERFGANFDKAAASALVRAALAQ